MTRDPALPDPASPPSTSGAAVGYRCRRKVNAAQDRVFTAIATIDGLRHWWTGIVDGSADPGEHVTFGFRGLDERIVMRVDQRHAPNVVAWTCLAHTRNDEWTGSTIQFQLTASAPVACELDFHHAGIAPQLVAAGWEHFLGSLAGYVERGAGSPYGADL